MTAKRKLFIISGTVCFLGVICLYILSEVRHVHWTGMIPAGKWALHFVDDSDNPLQRVHVEGSLGLFDQPVPRQSDARGDIVFNRKTPAQCGGSSYTVFGVTFFESSGHFDSSSTIKCSLDGYETCSVALSDLMDKGRIIVEMRKTRR